MDTTDHVLAVLYNDRDIHQELTQWAGSYSEMWEGTPGVGEPESAWELWRDWTECLKQRYEKQAEMALESCPPWLRTIGWHTVKDVNWWNVSRVFMPDRVMEAAEKHLQMVRGEA